MGSGVRLGTTGLEFDPRLISLGSDAGVRVAGAAHFPRQIPVPEGEQLLDWQIDRLGVPPPHYSMLCSPMNWMQRIERVCAENASQRGCICASA